MKYNVKAIMRRAWELRREKGFSMMVALRLAWGEAKGEKRYTLNLENIRAQISSYLVKLTRKENRDIHEEHKLAILRDALTAKIDAHGMTVFDGKTVGLCKYAVRNA